MTTPDPPDLVGRDAHLAVLTGLVSDLGAARGRSVLVEGEPGIGKSALLAACVAQAREAGFTVAQGACDALGRRLPLSVLREILSTGAMAQTPDDKRDAYGWSVPMAAGDAVTAESEKLAAVVDRWCAAGPLLVAVDDLQWADDASLLLWRRLSRATVQLPLLLVGACRPIPHREELEGLRRDLRSRGGVSIALLPLPDASVEELARRLAGGRPGRQLSARLESTAGNPLYVREMVDAFTRAGVLAVANGAAELIESTGPGLTASAADADATLATAIADRLDFLSPEARAVLSPAALLGTDFAVSDVAGAVDQPLSALMLVLEEALAAGVLEEAGARLRFRHPLIRQALHESTPESARSALLRRTAQAAIASGASVGRVAEVLLRAADAADGWETGWLAENADALARQAPEAAAELFERALTHTPADDPRRAVLEDRLVAVLHRLVRTQDVERIARRILAGDPDPGRAAQTAWLLGHTLTQANRGEEAHRLLAEYAADPRTEPVWRARLTSLLAIAAVAHGDMAAAREITARAIAEAGKTADPLATAWAMHAGSTMAMMIDQDIEACFRHLEAGLAVTGPGQDAAVGDAQFYNLRLLMLVNRVQALGLLDRFAEIPEALQRARALAERIGAQQLGNLRVQAADFAYSQGRWDDALAELEPDGDPEHVFRPQYRIGLIAEILLHRGDRRRARQLLETASQDPVEAGYAISLMGPLLTARSLDAEMAGDPALACRMLAAILTADYEKVTNDRSAMFPPLVRWGLESGYRTMALRATQAAEKDAREDPTALRQGTADWCRGLLTDDPDAVLAASDYFRRTGRRLAHGNALEDAAVLLAEAGRQAAAREAFDGALAEYDALGALWDARRGAKRLRVLGIRPNVRGTRGRPRSGWEALTATELRVAELVAEGRSNPDIADRLQLSRRTVETHVAHILAKLKARSRRDVADRSPLAGPPHH